MAYLSFPPPICLLICNSSLQAHVLENQDKPRHGLVNFRWQDIPQYSSWGKGWSELWTFPWLFSSFLCSSKLHGLVYICCRLIKPMATSKVISIHMWMKLHTIGAHLIHLSPHNLSTQAVFREWTAHQHIHAIATGDRKRLDALAPPILGPTEHSYLSSPLTALPSHFSTRWLLISYLSGPTYGGKQVVEVVVRGSLIHREHPQRVSSAPFALKTHSYRVHKARVKCKPSQESLLQTV